MTFWHQRPLRVRCPVLEKYRLYSSPKEPMIWQNEEMGSDISPICTVKEPGTVWISYLPLNFWYSPWSTWPMSFLHSSVWKWRETGHRARTQLGKVDRGDLYKPGSIPGAIMHFMLWENVLTAETETAGLHHGVDESTFGSFILFFGHLHPQHCFPMMVSCCNHSLGKQTAEQPHHTQEVQFSKGFLIFQSQPYCCLLCVLKEVIKLLWPISQCLSLSFSPLRLYY